MAKQKEILEEARLQGFAQPSAGMSVPEGYFDAVNDRIIASLPYRPEAEERPLPPRTIWQKVRPYVYMAAMFAGIWLMLQMFAMMGSPKALTPMGDNPILAEAFSNDDFVFDYLYDDLSTYDIYNELYVDDSSADDGFDDIVSPHDIFSTQSFCSDTTI